MMSNNILPTNEEKKNTRWKYLSFLTIGILMTATTAELAFQIPQHIMQVQQVNAPPIVQKAYGAGILTNVFAMPADNLFSTKTYYTIAFTTATAGSIKIIEMIFPTGFNVASAKLIQAQNIGTGSLSVSGQTVKYTVTSSVPVTAPKTIQIMIGDITNPVLGANPPPNQVAVTTKEFSGPNQVILDGPTNSATFTLIQVSNAMLASNAVTRPKITANSVDSSKIGDGTLVRADMSATFMKKNVVADCDTCSDGWIPDGSLRVFYKIIDTAVVDNSVVALTTDTFAPDSCAAFIIEPGSFNVACRDPVINGAKLNYVVIN
jgi:hypothetical protein